MLLYFRDGWIHLEVAYTDIFDSDIGSILTWKNSNYFNLKT